MVALLPLLQAGVAQACLRPHFPPPGADSGSLLEGGETGDRAGPTLVAAVVAGAALEGWVLAVALHLCLGGSGRFRQEVRGLGPWSVSLAFWMVLLWWPEELHYCVLVQS